jgi:glutathione S-transferase
MITVWGRATSGNVQIIMWALAELGLKCERHDVGGAFGGNRTPEFLAMNPNGLVPVVRDGDGAYLWESAAIVRYLGATYGDEQFWPASPAKRVVADKWSEWMKTTFVPAFYGGLFWSIIGATPDKRDHASIAAAVEKVKPLARMLDARLSESAYLGGDDICFADIIVGTPLFRYFTLEFERADTPHLRAYYDRLAKRPAYAEHAMVSYDSLRAK